MTCRCHTRYDALLVAFARTHALTLLRAAPQSAAELAALAAARLRIQADALHAHFETTVAAQLAQQAVRSFAHSRNLARC
jgi:hypothetical protein